MTNELLQPNHTYNFDYINDVTPRGIELCTEGRAKYIDLLDWLQRTPLDGRCRSVAITQLELSLGMAIKAVVVRHRESTANVPYPLAVGTHEENEPAINII